MNKLKNRLRKIFEYENITHISSKELVEFEIRLYIISKLKNNVSIDVGWSIFTRYFDVYKTIEEDEISIKDIFNLRKDNHSYSTAGKWKIIKEKYFELDKKYRNFELDKNGYINEIIPKYESDRIKTYNKYIESIDLNRKRSIYFAEEEIEYKSIEKKDGINTYRAYKAEVIEIDENVHKTMSVYKNKKYVKLSKDKDWSQVLRSMGNGFEKRPNISMNILNQDKDIDLKGLIHIVGALGAGKSTYKFAQVYEGVKSHNLKIGIIEDTVPNVLSTVKVLRKLNINAIPVIGTTTEQNHLYNYLLNENDYEDIENDFIVKLLSGSCIVKAISKDDESNISYPCNRLYEGLNKVSCPYSTKCGHMERFRLMSEADVLVTTPHNIVKGNIPEFIDPYNRSMYEIFHDTLDMIIVDEADGVQSTFDSQLMPSAKVNYGEDSLLSWFSSLKSELDKIRNTRDNMSEYKYIKNVTKLESILYSCERILPKLNRVKTCISNRMWTPTEVFKDIKKSLSNYDENKSFIDHLEKYVEFTDTFNISEDNLIHSLNELYNKVSDIHLIDEYSEQRLINEIDTLLLKYNIKISSKLDKNLLIEKICFLVLLVQLDYILKIISKEYPYIYYSLYGKLKNVDTFDSVNRKLQHLIKEPCIGTIYGYKINYNEGLNIDVIRYDGVGRSMLESWSTCKQDKGIEGPCVICLSGTSYSPGSAHYNLKKVPDILLLGKEEGNIKMSFLPKVHNDKYLRISGTNNRIARLDNLKVLTKKIIPDIKYELEKLDGRKVMLVVNSYDDCKAVGEVLKLNNMNYVLVLKEKEYNSVNKDYIEHIPKMDIDVCVVPLSIISRGYNILNDENNSYFGSMFFMVRPYMVPGDFSSYIQILHHYLSGICSNLEAKSYSYEEKVDRFRKLCYMKFSDILDMSYWKMLSSEEKEIMSWFMMVPIKQAIGRMQRNGNECNVLFCDVAFSQSIVECEKADIKNSILYGWYDTLSNCIDNPVINTLYGQFYKALENMINEVDQEIIDFTEEEWD